MAHDHSDAAAHAGHAAAHAHPSGATYVKVGAILTLITVVEVWAYYVPALVASPFFNPGLIIMSAVTTLIFVSRHNT